MTSPKKTVRVFISSTFKDMHAERDHLVTVIFPELRERCEQLGLEFFDVDLRWGVPEKGADGETANSWEYCRQWIDRVEPFFIGILGQRYGWIPEPDQLKDSADQERQIAYPRSITDMEVRRAVLDSGLKRQSYFYLREAEVPTTADDFVDPPELLQKLAKLKEEVRACGRPVRDYPCEWRDSSFMEMEAFGRMVLEDLWSGILRDERYVRKEVWRQVLGCDPDSDPRYTEDSVPVPEEISEKIIPLAKPPPKDPLEAEREEMAAFADSRLRWFQGRKKELEELTSFILDPAEDDKPRLALVAAEPGQGKSALMAKLSRSIPADDRFIITHFVGATAKSSNTYALVKRILDELDASGIGFPQSPMPEGEGPKLDFETLCQRLWDLLSDYDGERRIVIILDALNQLDDDHDLDWLPNRIGPGVRIVGSCIDSESTDEESPERMVLTALDSRCPKPKFVPLGGLKESDVRTIVVHYLREYCKELDAGPIETICALPQAKNPLYLLVLLGELRTLGGNDMNWIVPELIASLGDRHPDTISLFDWVLERLEVFGVKAVQWWCLYLALGRVGMSGQELSDLLSRKFEADPDAAAKAKRIERGLRSYLQLRGEQLDFFHGQLRQAVIERYGGEATVVQGHRAIAKYFRAHADPADDQSWKGENQRHFNETATHLIGAEDWDDLCAYLTDFRCLDVRIRAQRVFDVVKDHTAAVAALPELAGEGQRQRDRVVACAQYGDAIADYVRGRGAGKPPSLPEPPDSGGREDTGPPSGKVSPRSDRLRVIANFITEKASFLVEFPGDFLPLAANASAEGPLDEATTYLQNRGVPWLQREIRPPAPPLRRACLRTLHGHTGEVYSVAFSPDCSRALSGSRGRDNTLRLWDLRSGHCLHTLRQPIFDSLVPSVAFTPDGSRAFSGSDFSKLFIWDLSSGQCLQTINRNTMQQATSVAFSPDGSRAIIAGENNLYLWDLLAFQPISVCGGLDSRFRSAVLSFDGTRALSVSDSDDNALRLWDLHSGDCIHTLHGHTSWVYCAAISSDGSRAISGSYDNTLRFWDLHSGQCLRVLEGHKFAVTSVALSPDGSRALSGSNDYTLRLWDLHSGHCLNTLWGHTGFVTSVALSPDGSHALSGSADNTLRLWDLHSDEFLAPARVHTHFVTCMALSSDGSLAVSGSIDNSLRALDLRSGQCIHILQGHTDRVTSVALTADGCRALSGSCDNTLRFWDLHSGKCLHSLQGRSKVALTPDGSRALSGSDDHTLRHWDLYSGKCLHILNGHRDEVHSLVFSPDDSRALSGGGGRDNTLRHWDLHSGKCLHTLLGHTGEVRSIAISSDGFRALSGSCDSTLRYWDLHSGQCLRTLQGHTNWVTSVALTADNCCALSGSCDNTLRFWDLHSGKCLYTLHGHTGRVRCVALFPDGSRAVSGSDDKTLRVWNLHSRKCLAIYHASAHVLSVSISLVDGRISFGTRDGEMHLLNLRNFP